MIVRAASVEDAPALSELRWLSNQEFGSAPEPLSDFAPRVASWMRAHLASHQAFLGLERGRPIAMAWLASLDRLPDAGTDGRTYGEIQSVYVVPALRSQGRGAQLIDAVIEHAEARGIASLTVRPSRRSITFYRRLGFHGGDAVLIRP